MNTPKFWPLDYDTDGEIYENVSWDLPGFRPRQPHRRSPAKPSPQKSPRRH
jgi:hypothetical protein